MLDRLDAGGGHQDLGERFVGQGQHQGSDDFFSFSAMRPTMVREGDPAVTVP